MKRLRLPGDKSVGHRALILSALAEGRSEIEGIGDGADLHSTIRVLRALGVEIEADGGRLWVRGGRLRAANAPLDCGNSGTTLRLLTGLLAAMPFDSLLIGDEALTRRPMARLSQTLAPLGARIHTVEGRPPVRVEGQRLRGARLHPPVASAQLKGAALLAGLQAQGVTEIIELGPSRDHTERMLWALGVDLQRDGALLRLRPPARLPAAHWRLPGDPSTAAFFWAAAALRPGRAVEALGVSLNPTRLGFLDALRAFGAEVEIRAEGALACGDPIGDVRVTGRGLRGIEVAGELALRAIDELPLVAILGAAAEGVTRVGDAAELRHKESDRIEATAAGLRALGVEIEALPDGWRVQGGPINGGLIDPHGDHRLAMGFALLNGISRSPIQISDRGCVAVSYPEFWSTLADWGHS